MLRIAMKNARSESGQSSPLSAFPLTARSNQSEQRIRPTFRGSILDADPPTQGVKNCTPNDNTKAGRSIRHGESQRLRGLEAHYSLNLLGELDQHR